MINQDHLSKSPAIIAIAKASESKEKLPVYDLGSGNAMDLKLFNSIELEVPGNLPDELRIIAEGIKKGYEDVSVYAEKLLNEHVKSQEKAFTEQL